MSNWFRVSIIGLCVHYSTLLAGSDKGGWPGRTRPAQDLVYVFGPCLRPHLTRFTNSRWFCQIKSAIHYTPIFWNQHFYGTQLIGPTVSADLTAVMVASSYGLLVKNFLIILRKRQVRETTFGYHLIAVSLRVRTVITLW